MKPALAREATELARSAENPAPSTTPCSCVSIVERSALRGIVKFEILEQIINDLTVVETYLGQLLAGDFDHLVNVTDLARVRIVQRPVCRIVGLGTGSRFYAA